MSEMTEREDWRLQVADRQPKRNDDGPARYRKISEITEEEFYAALTSTPQKQKDIFVKLGGDPSDHNYAYLSLLTQRLRRRGKFIASSRHKGVWLP